MEIKINLTTDEIISAVALYVETKYPNMKAKETNVRTQYNRLKDAIVLCEMKKVDR